MLELWLFRHAKSRWDEAGVADFDRGLAPRGIDAARRMGRWLDEVEAAPRLVLCSPAKRARATYELAEGAWRARAEFALVDALYGAAPGDIADALSANGAISPILVIGHNPGLEDLAKLVVGHGEPEAIGDMSAKFPTAAIARIAFPIASWSEIAVGKGELVIFAKPRGLAD